MEVILRQDVIDLGYEGDIVKVADGYARNYLIPKALAVKATPQNLRMVEQIRRKIEVKRLRAKEEAEQFKTKLEALELIFLEKAAKTASFMVRLQIWLSPRFWRKKAW